MANKLPIPPRLTALIEAGIWPGDRETAERQNRHSIVPPERVRAIAPNERYIYLHHPPFQTAAEEMRYNGPFWQEYGALDQIDASAALIIAEFEIGSDSCVILDYREAVPVVLRLHWPEGGGGKRNEWVRCAQTFEEFAELLGLTNERRSPV